MTLDYLIEFISRNFAIILVGTVTVIQIVPIKLNPWSWLAETIKNALIGDLEKEVKALQKDMLDEKVNVKRWNILDFQNSCLQERRHTKEEWEHCIDELAWYEDYCKRHEIPNGVMVECGEYLRTSYRRRLEQNDFL